jgi:hypothetical protein
MGLTVFIIALRQQLPPPHGINLSSTTITNTGMFGRVRRAVVFVLKVDIFTFTAVTLTNTRYGISFISIQYPFFNVLTSQGLNNLIVTVRAAAGLFVHNNWPSGMTAPNVTSSTDDAVTSRADTNTIHLLNVIVETEPFQVQIPTDAVKKFFGTLRASHFL